MLVDNTTKSSTFIDEAMMIKKELLRWFSILTPEYSYWPSNNKKLEI
jgi:hypothetical protein